MRVPWTVRLVDFLNHPMYKLGLRKPWHKFLQFWKTKVCKNIPGYRCQWCSGDFEEYANGAGHARELCHCKCPHCKEFWDAAWKDIM